MNIRFQHILTLIHLLFLGARQNYVELTTTQLSKNIDRSQQSASKYVLELESMGYVDRIRTGHSMRIKITDKGYLQVSNFYNKLHSAIESYANEVITLEGRVVSGMGEGAYYMSLEGYRKQFRQKLGYTPFPGTLNIKLSDPVSIRSRRDLSTYPSIFINGFSDNVRTYGWVKCYPAEINKQHIENAALLVLERTHYDDNTIEIIAPISIKESTKIKNGNWISVTVRNTKGNEPIRYYRTNPQDHLSSSSS
jgi:riboflavin kinase, archaea type